MQANMVQSDNNKLASQLLNGEILVNGFP